MTIGLHFAPDAARARALNWRMHDELAASLTYVCEESRGILPFDEGAMGTLLSGLKTGANYPPAAFARYYEIVDAITEDRLDDARNLFAELGRARPWRKGLDVKVLGSAELGAESERYGRLMNTDPTIGFAAPDDDQAAAFRERLAQGLDLMQRGLPELAAEINAIVREIVISGGDANKMMQFDGGSHYRLWGALFLNAEFHPTPVAVVEVLAHESAHSLLFGFCTQEALVENADDELYTSPLRADPRPMDGIYHATFVSARMHWAMTHLIKTGLLSPQDIEQARGAAAIDRANFESGYGVVAEHGRLTGIGKALMAGAKAYMDSQR